MSLPQSLLVSTSLRYSLYLNLSVLLNRKYSLCRCLNPRCNRFLNQRCSQNLRFSRLLSQCRSQNPRCRRFLNRSHSQRLFPFLRQRPSLSQLRPQSQKPPPLW